MPAMRGEVYLRGRRWAGRLWREHWPLACILAVAAVLLFTRLGGDYLWSDEGDTAVLARSILRFGVPTAWDGVTFTDSDFGARLNDNLVMVSHPWLQYYVTAASFALFGETALAARVPFALCGLATIVLIYAIVWRVTRQRWTAASAAVLLTLSVQFLIYARQSRHYSLNAALTCLLVLQFSRLNSWGGSLIFAVVGILLFHSHPIAIAPIAALGLLTLVYPPYREQRRWFWRAVPIIAVFTLPWLVIARAGYAENTGLAGSAAMLVWRMAQFAVESASVTPDRRRDRPGGHRLAATTLTGGCRLRPRRGGAPPSPALFTPAERALVMALLSIMAVYAVVMGLTQPRDELFALGLRYTPAVIPFMAVITALLIAKVSRGKWPAAVALLLVLGFTKVGRLTPWTFWEEPLAKRDPASVVTFHNPPKAVDRVLRTGQLGFVEGLYRDNPGTTAGIVEFLKSHASPDDIVVTNYGWEPLYFHTRLPQGLTVLSSYPIYGAAKARGLPDYVFRADGARWIVWRQAWGRYRGQALDQVLAKLEADHVPVSLVARVRETLWENRENIHFRRFPNSRYIYPWYGDLPDTLIYRVDWPSAPGGSRGASGAISPSSMVHRP